MENTNQLTVAKLLEVLKKYLVWIILAAVVFGCGAAVIAQLAVKDKFTCKTEYVLADLTDYSSTELSNMPKFIFSAIKYLSSTPCVKKVVEEANIVIPGSSDSSSAVSQMKKSLTFTENANESGFTISVTTNSPEVSFAMIRTYEDLIPEMVENHGLKPLELIEPIQKAPTSPSNGSRAVRYGLIGAAAGAVLFYALFLIKHLTDVTIRNEHDLKKYVELPVLGLIPMYSGEIESGEKIIKKNESIDQKT